MVEEEEGFHSHRVELATRKGDDRLQAVVLLLVVAREMGHK